jgi:hypothetical protein
MPTPSAPVVEPASTVFTLPPVTAAKPTDTTAPVVPGSTVGNDTLKVSTGTGKTAADAPIELQIQRAAELSDVYTRSEGFRTVVVKSDEPALVVFRGVPDQYTESGTRVSLTVPADAFAHTQPKEVVRLAVTQQDGRPLPTWVQFNAQTGQFSGEVPKGTTGELKIKIIARDMQGREATALFRVNIGVNGKTEPGKDAVKAPGKVGLSDRLRQGGPGALGALGAPGTSPRDGQLAVLARASSGTPRRG